jgi:hypothetical protein
VMTVGTHTQTSIGINLISKLHQVNDES